MHGILFLRNDVCFYIQQFVWTKLNEVTCLLVITRNRDTSTLLVERTNRSASSRYTITSTCTCISDITCKITCKDRRFTLYCIHIYICDGRGTRLRSLYSDIQYGHQILKFQIDSITFRYC